MTNISRCHQLHARLVSRFQVEKPSIIISDKISKWLYQAIYSIYENYGEEEAERYVREARLL
ncbi:MAG: hypothetical protein K6B68_07725 [Eubacterium sp.]|nr:hypothetical protein [Eubacterium sp.]